MVGTQTKLKYEQACDLFGDDIGEYNTPRKLDQKIAANKIE